MSQAIVDNFAGQSLEQRFRHAGTWLVDWFIATRSFQVRSSHMQSGPDNRLTMIRHYYKAYEDDDRKTIEQLLHPRFTFTSPQDDRIDRATYFERCWPPHEHIESFALLDVCADPDRALVRYQATESSGPGFASVERFEFSDDLISHIEVYFGRALT